MSKKEELKNEIEKVWHIYMYAIECFQISHYLHKPESELEINYLNKSSLFNFIKHSFWRLTVIELAKIFSSSKNRDRYNLLHIISKLKSNGDYRKLKMDFKKISIWESKLKENETTINNILILRDKIYSHTDPNKEKYIDSDLTFEKTQKLFDLTKLIIKDVYAQIFDADPHFRDSLIGADNLKFVKILAENKKNEMEKIMERFLQDSNKNKSS